MYKHFIQLAFGLLFGLICAPIFAQEDLEVANGLWFDGLGSPDHETGAAVNILYTQLNEQVLGWKANQNLAINDFNRQARVAQPIQLVPDDETNCLMASIEGFTLFAYVPDANPGDLSVIRDVNLQIWSGLPNASNLIFDGVGAGKDNYEIEEVYFDPPEDIKEIGEDNGVQFNPTYRQIDSVTNAIGQFSGTKYPIFIISVKLKDPIFVPVNQGSETVTLVWNFETSESEAFIPPAVSFGSIGGAPPFLSEGRFFDPETSQWKPCEDSLQQNLIQAGLPVIVTGKYGGKANPTNPNIEATQIDTVKACEGGIVNLGAGLVGLASGIDPIIDYNWQGPTPVNDVNPADISAEITAPGAPGFYIVTLTHNSGCKSVDSIYFDLVDPANFPTASAPADIVTCADDLVEFIGSASGGTPPYTFEWTPVGNLTAPDQQVTEVAAGVSGEFSLVVTDDLGCESEEDVVSVTRQDLEIKFTFEEDSDSLVCQDDDAFKIVAGPYFGDAAKTLEGNFSNLTAGIAIFSDGETIEGTSDVQVEGLDGNPAGSPVTLNLADTDDLIGDELGFNAILDEICLDGNGIQGNNISELQLDVTTPGGTTITLFSALGINDINDNSDLGCSPTRTKLTNVCFSRTAINEISCLNFSGAVAPQDGANFDALNDGSNPQDPWTVNLIDLRTGGGNSSINAGDLIFKFKQKIVEVTPDDALDSPEGGIGPDDILVSALYSIAGNCNTDKTLELNVFDLPQFSVSRDGDDYIITSLCKDNNASPSQTELGDTIVTSDGSLSNVVDILTDGHPWEDNPNFPNGYSFTWEDENGDDIFSPNGQGEVIARVSPETLTDTALILYNPDGSRTLTLTISDQYECEQEVRIQIPVVEAAQEDLVYCQFGTDPVEGTLGGGTSNALTQNGGNLDDFVIGYEWKRPSSFLNPTDENPGRLLSTDVSSTYTLVVTDQDPAKTQCIDSTVFSVKVKNAPIVNAGDEIFACRGDSARLGEDPIVTGGNGPQIDFDFLWEPSTNLSDDTDPRPFFDPGNIGGSVDYTLSVEDTLGCIGKDIVTITIVEPPIANAGDSTFSCTGITTSLGGNNCTTGIGSGPFSYRWFPSTDINNAKACNPEVNPTDNRTYTVVVTDIFGCTARDSVFVDVITDPILNAGDDREICLGEQVQLGGTPTGLGVPPFSYSWGPAINLTNTQVSNPIAQPESTQAYILSLSDARGCVDKDTVTITVNTTPLVNIAGITDVCENIATEIGGPNVVSEGTAPFVYQWEPAGLFDDPNNPNPNITASNSQVISLRVSDGKGCEGFSTTELRVNKNPLVKAGDSKFGCVGDDVRLGSSPTAEGGTSPYTYRWFPRNRVSDSTVANPIFDANTTTVFTVKVVDAQGCLGTATTRVNVSTPPVADAGFEITACQNQAFNLGGPIVAQGGVPPYNYSWKPGVYLNDDQAASPTAFMDVNKVFTLILTDSVGCQDTSVVSVTVEEKPTVDAGFDNVVCVGNQVPVGGNPTASGGTAPYFYNWSPSGNLISNATIANPFATPNSNTTYTVRVTDGNGCIDSSFVTIQTLQTPTASFIPQQDMQNRSRILFFNTSLDAFSYKWDFGDATTSTIASPEKLYSQNGVFTVKLLAESIDGCTDQTQGEIEITAVGMDHAEFKSISVRPTISSSSITISGLSNEINSIQILNLNGKLMKSFDSNNQSEQIEVQVSDWAQGIYIIQLASKSGNTASQKFIVR